MAIFILFCLLGLISVKVDAYTADIRIDARTTFSKADFVELPNSFNPNYVKQIHWSSGASSEKTNIRETQNAVAEIFVFVDSVLANKLGDDSAVYKYMSATWNMVNRRYREVQDPSITVKLVGIRIARSLADESFLVFHEDGVILDRSTLGSYAKWIKDNREELPPHDIAYLSLGRDIHGIGGVAYLNGACYDHSDIQLATAMGSDWGAFSGIHIASHEIGHSLGCLDHDGDDGTCPKDTGNVMNGHGSGVAMCTFSECSKAAIKNYIATRGTCLHENVGSADEIAKFDYNLMPVDVMTLNEQCKQITGYSQSTFWKSYTTCTKICCGKETYGVIYGIEPVTGTTEVCSTAGQKCLDCVCQ